VAAEGDVLGEVTEVAHFGEQFVRDHHRVVIVLRPERIGQFLEFPFEETEQGQQLAAQAGQPLAKEPDIGGLRQLLVNGAGH
jgi:hypothetical protein